MAPRKHGIYFAIVVLALLTLFAGELPAQDLAGRLSTQIAKGRAALGAFPASATDFVKGESAGARSQFSDVEAHLQASRPLLALETLSSACASVDALAAAAAGWDKDGKGIDALEKDWNAAGLTLAQDRKKFPARAPAGQPAFVRALAEISLAQVQENYAASLDYGRFSGLEFGAYYLGRAQGHMAFALFSSTLIAETSGLAIAAPDLAARIAALEKEILAAYAKPGSTTFHSSFIVANSSIKLARELNAQGYRTGALVILIRAFYALGQTQIAAPALEELAALRAQADDWAKRIAALQRDSSIPQQYLQKTQLALAAGAADGEAGNQQRQRAALFMNVVLPRYFEIMEGAK